MSSPRTYLSSDAPSELHFHVCAFDVHRTAMLFDSAYKSVIGGLIDADSTSLCTGSKSHAETLRMPGAEKALIGEQSPEGALRILVMR